MPGDKRVNRSMEENDNISTNDIDGGAVGEASPGSGVGPAVARAAAGGGGGERVLTRLAAKVAACNLTLLLNHLYDRPACSFSSLFT